MKMKKLNIYIIGLLTLMLCGIQSCALESEVFDEITPSIYPQTERDVRAPGYGKCLFSIPELLITEVCIM